MVTRYTNVPAQFAEDLSASNVSDMGIDTSHLNEPRSRVHTGAVRIAVGYGDTVQEGVARHSVSFDGHQGGSVMATLSKVGAVQTVELEPGNPASRTLLSIAEKQGLVRTRDGGGVGRRHHSQRKAVVTC